jgi:hypothetical protein
MLFGVVGKLKDHSDVGFLEFPQFIFIVKDLIQIPVLG